MSYFKIVNISKEDLALARKRQVSISVLARKYGVQRATMIKKLSHHGIERYVLRGKRPEDRKVIAVDQKDVDALTAKQTSFYRLVHNCPAINRRASTDYGNHLSNRVLF